MSDEDIHPTQMSLMAVYIVKKIKLNPTYFSNKHEIKKKRFVKMIHESVRKPVFVLVDCNPFGVEIYRTLKYGSNTMTFMSHNLVVSSSIMIGMFHLDLIQHKIDETTMIPLKFDCDKGDVLKSQDWMPL